MRYEMFRNSLPDNIEEKEVDLLWQRIIDEANETVFKVIEVIRPKYVLFTTINGGERFFKYLQDKVKHIETRDFI